MLGWRAIVMVLVLSGGVTTLSLALPDASPPPPAAQVTEESLLNASSQSNQSRYTDLIRVGGNGATLNIRIHYSLFANLPNSGAMQIVVVGSRNRSAIAMTGVGIRLQPRNQSVASDTTLPSRFNVNSVWRLNIPTVGVADSGTAGFSSPLSNETIAAKSGLNRSSPGPGNESATANSTGIVGSSTEFHN